MNDLKDLTVRYSIHNTSFGDMFIASTEKGVCAIHFIEDQCDTSLKWLEKFFSKENTIKDCDFNYPIFQEIEEYFCGKRKAFDFDIHIIGTDFQKNVWKVLLDIEYGELYTYKDVALRLGDAKKCRAVGGAIGKNPIVLAIPCHRVVGSNGKLTGFSAPGGIHLKSKLLDLEKNIVTAE